MCLKSGVVGADNNISVAMTFKKAGEEENVGCAGREERWC